MTHAQVGEINLDSLSKAREGRDEEVIDVGEINPKELSEGVVPSMAKLTTPQDVVVGPDNTDDSKTAALPLPSDVIDQQPLRHDDQA